MVADDLKFLDILKGKRIKLTLKTSSYLGVIQRVNANKTLVLADVVDGSNGLTCPGTKMFFGREIMSVEFANGADSGNIHDPKHEEHLNIEKFQPYRKSFSFGEDDEDEEYVNFEVIDDFHDKFGAAVMHIKKQHVIGLGADGVELFKNGILCWLQIATKKKVYLFDILLLGVRAFKNGLSTILESGQILKVIHDCRALSGCLIAHFGVKLTNVFDTQAADVMCFYSKTGGFLPDRVSTLEEVVSLHLRVPSSQLLSLQIKSQLTEEEKEMWYKRPCPLPMLKVMALSVIHLHPLRLVLLDALMMDYVAVVDSYLNSSHYQPDELEHVTMESVLELPRELRQLKEMHHERQKWAAGHYPVTEQGFLDRFNPRPQSPPAASPETQKHEQTQAESSEPAAVESTSTEVELLHHTQTTRPPRLDSVSPVVVQTSPEPAAQTSVPDTVSDLRKQMSVSGPLPVGVGRGWISGVMDTMGRGRPLGKEPVLPAIGRGFLHQISQTQIPREISEDMERPGRMGTVTLRSNNTLTEEVKPSSSPNANDLPKDASDLRGEHLASSPKSLISSVTQSFRSFRH